MDQQHVTPTGTSGEQDFYRPDAQTAPAPPSPAMPAQWQDPVNVQPLADLSASPSYTWTSAEFVEHQKSSSWYLAFGIVGIGIAAVIWFISKDLFLAVAIAIGMIAFGFYANRHPRQQTYTIDGYGLVIGELQYAYADFRSFSVMQDGPLISVELTPLKRFAMYVTIYLQPADEERVVGILSAHLAMTPPRNDMTDQLMRRIKF